MPTVKEIVTVWLGQNKYDGLYDDGVCACSLEDLMPCDAEVCDCEAGYRTPCNCDEGCEFHISKEKNENVL